MRKINSIKVKSGLLLLWCGFIFARSMQPAPASTQESERVRQLLSAIGMTELSMVLVRKCAHFTEFAVLGVLAAALFLEPRRRALRTLLYALMTGMTAALCDETIQLFVEGRTGSVADVWLDISGAAAGALLAIGVWIIAHKYRKDRKNC